MTAQRASHPCRSDVGAELDEAAGATGLFGETWEINEPGLRIHPWFATASGNCVFAVNEMLVKSPQAGRTMRSVYRTARAAGLRNGS